jgi:hypothetical protein
MQIDQRVGETLILTLPTADAGGDARATSAARPAASAPDGPDGPARPDRTGCRVRKRRP